ncbi:MAG: serine protease [Synergistaceae bacterium]|jgi:hypothetical protein|nr:serine protease [Synergistaceae bacterium]
MIMKRLANALAAQLVFAAALTAVASYALEPSEIFKINGDSVVTIYCENKNGTENSGSGFFVEKGLVMTNSHVIGDAKTVAIELKDERRFPVLDIVAQDPEVDVALLRVAYTDAPSLKIAGELPGVGHKVTVIGAPLGFSHSLSDGTLSAVRKSDYEAIQITAPISPGSSGSPVFDSSGQVIGIVTFYMIGGQNMNFAPSATALRNFLKSRPMITVQEYEIKRRAENQREYGFVAPGETIFKDGSYNVITSVTMRKPAKGKIENDEDEAVAFEIKKPVRLQYAATRDDVDYFEAPRDTVSATFGGKSVIDDGDDSVGVYVVRENDERGWYVDNSGYANQDSLWARPFEDKEGDSVEVTVGMEPMPGKDATWMIYKGVSGGKILFSVTYVSNGQITDDSGEFSFPISELPEYFPFFGRELDVDRVEGATLFFGWN